MRIILAAAVIVGMAGYASAPSSAQANETAPAAQPVANAEPVAAAATPAAAAATPAAAAATPAAAAAAPTDAEKPFKPPAGYKANVDNGQTMYCKKVTVTGSRFPKDLCMTEAQLRDLEATNESMRQNKDQSSRVCVGVCGGQ